MIEYDNFQKSLKNLELQFNHLTTLDENQTILIQEGIKESVIQRFEICFDSLWKVLNLYLQEEIGLNDLQNGPNPTLRVANQNNLLNNNIEQWFSYAKARNITSHEYGIDKAELAINLIPDFIDDAIGLYQTMTEKSWE